MKTSGGKRIRVGVGRRGQGGVRGREKKRGNATYPIGL